MGPVTVGPNAVPAPDSAPHAIVEQIQSAFSSSTASADASGTWAVMEDLMTQLEAATPLAPWVHARAGIVRRWVALLRDGEDLARFGGAANIRDHIGRELRGLVAAVIDYERATPERPPKEA